MRFDAKGGTDWLQVFNRLFAIINRHEDERLYYSGNRFIKVVQQFSPYFPSYRQFLTLRNEQGKSTSRQDYYYDILRELDESTRANVVRYILNEVRPFAQEEVHELEGVLWRSGQTDHAVNQPSPVQVSSESPIVFISYSWDSESHKDWVLQLANRLCGDGVDVLLDRYHLRPGKNVSHFVESSIERASRVLLILTPDYKRKAMNRLGGVGFEYSIVHAPLLTQQATNNKFVPILRQGAAQESVPDVLRQFIYIDARDAVLTDERYEEILREIYDEAVVVRPQIGTRPDFSRPKESAVARPELGTAPRFEPKTGSMADPNIVSKLRFNTTRVLTLRDGRTVNAGVLRVEDGTLIYYTGKGLREIWKSGKEEIAQKRADELKEQSEEYLIENGYMDQIDLGEIVGIDG